MLYLDHCATTPPLPEIIQVMGDCMAKYMGNPSSLHRLGVEAEGLLGKARQVMAAALQVKPGELILTSGGTESNNAALKGAAWAYQGRGRHLITSSIEHSSVYETCCQLEQMGFQVTYLPVDRTGAVRIEDLENAITDDTILVSLMLVNNETGRLQPVQEAGRLLSRYPKVLFHVDAVQGLGKLPVRPKAWGVDLMSLSAHKFRGPRGAGLLYKQEGVQLIPLLAGGGQEQGLRSGTENLPAAVGMARALRVAVENQSQTAASLYNRRSELISLLNGIEGIRLHGSDRLDQMAPHVIHFSCPGYRPEVLIRALEEREIYISSRSACSSGEVKPSRVLTAMGVPYPEAISALRVSLSAEHTQEDMACFVSNLKEVMELHGSIHEGRER